MLPQCKNAEVQSISREVDAAWLAGILDGEGNLQFTIKIAKNGKVYFMPKIRVSNTDMRMIQRISQIYSKLGIVFFYTTNFKSKYKPTWKNQVCIEVASQGSTKKIYEYVLPYLVNKQKIASIILSAINYVQKQPKGGNTKSIKYVEHPVFLELQNAYEKEKSWYIDPSTTTRRANSILEFDDIV